MPAKLDLVWINKTQGSSSLSNCINERATYREIRTHVQIAGHKSRCSNRAIKRASLDLKWARTNIKENSSNNLGWQSENPISEAHKLSTSECNDRIRGLDSFLELQNPRGLKSKDNSERISQLHRLSTVPDPFSSYTINLSTMPLELLWYFDNIWSQSAFKIDGCVGFGDEPIDKDEITIMIQLLLGDATRSYCLLAATSARMHYIHNHEKAQNGGSDLANRYAAGAMYGVRQRLQKLTVFSEEDSTDILFLAAYELFCLNEPGAAKHLAAVRNHYKQEIQNNFVRRLQANLEVLVGGGAKQNWSRDINRLVQSR